MRLKVLTPSQAMKDDSGKANMKTMGSQENELSNTDCHQIVKSSGQQGARRRVGGTCEVHRARASVACQTDRVAAYGDLSEAICSNASAASKTAASDKAEGTLKLMIKNFHNMNDTVRGPPVVVNGVPWKIMVMPRQHVMQKKGTQKCLGFFLQCCPEAYSDSWTCNASAELRLISQKSGVPNFTRKTTHNYSAKENDWGYSCFMTWADILDEMQGYIKDDKVVLEVYVKADPPKNILTYEGFVKKIQDYMRLADMQSSRGLIDKAIEVNQSALKFCKDKDEASKKELEEQKKKLIDLKLKQSIERIEKNKQPTAAPAEDADAAAERDNMLALKQALTGANYNKDKAKDSTNNNAVKKNKSKAVNGTDKGEKEVCEQMNEKFEKKIRADDEPSTSDDEPYSDDECDTCLMGHLETLEGESGPREMADTQCQTEPYVPPVNDVQQRQASAISALPTGDLTYEENSVVLPRGTLKAGSDSASIEEEIDTATRDSSLMLDQYLQPVDTHTEATADSADRQFLAPHLRNINPEIRNAIREHQLLDIITSDSRSSLDSIKETLERLVRLTHDGESQPQLDLDLETLRNMKERGGRLLSFGTSPQQDTHVVELQPSCTPPDTDVVDVGTGEQPPQIIPKRQLNEEQLQQHLRQLSVSQLQLDRCATLHEGQLPLELDQRDQMLIAKARQIVEQRAEQLVGKYTTLIEQCEASRLADTVRKVEQRMKDIERQTTNCRKELAEESERHQKEEQRLNKELKQARQDLEREREKVEKLSTQLRERKADAKKLEKRAKQADTLNEEVNDLRQRYEQLERDAENLRKELREEKKKASREKEQAAAGRKQMQTELQQSSHEIERLTAQLEERASTQRKQEHRANEERKQLNQQVRETTDRARKAETIVLELRQNMAVQQFSNLLEKAQASYKQYESDAQRYIQAGRSEDATLLTQYAQSLAQYRDKLQETLTLTKRDYSLYIENVRSGKTTLAQIQPSDLPKAPTPPKQLQLSGPPLQEQASVDSHGAKHAYNIGPIGAKPREQATGQRVATPTDQQSSRPGSTPQTPSTQQSIVPTQSSNRSPQQNEPSVPTAAAPAFGPLSTPPLSQERLPTTSGSTGAIGQPAPMQSGGVFSMNSQKNSMNGGAYNMWGSSGPSTILDVLRSGMVNGSSASPPSIGGSGGAGNGGGWDQWSGANGPQSSWSTNGIGAPATSWSSAAGYNAGLPPPFVSSNSRGASPAKLGFDEKEGPLAELLKRATQAFPMADEPTLQSLCGHVYRQHLTARTSNAELNMNEMLQSVLKLIEQHSSGSSYHPTTVPPPVMHIDSCVICRHQLFDYANKQAKPVVALSKCKHRFHQKCLAMVWSTGSEKNCCPTCRTINDKEPQLLYASGMQ